MGTVIILGGGRVATCAQPWHGFVKQSETFAGLVRSVSGSGALQGGVKIFFIIVIINYH